MCDVYSGDLSGRFWPQGAPRTIDSEWPLWVKAAALIRRFLNVHFERLVTARKQPVK